MQNWKQIKHYDQNTKNGFALNQYCKYVKLNFPKFCKLF